MARKLIDISVPLQNDVPADPLAGFMIAAELAQRCLVQLKENLAEFLASASSAAKPYR